MKTKHMEPEEMLKYKCESCDYRSNFVAPLWEHMYNKHQENKDEVNQRTAKDAVMNLLAEQNMDLMEEMIILKRDLKGAFEQQEVNMKSMQEEADRKDIKQTEAIKALVNIIDRFENNSKFAYIDLANKITSLTTLTPPFQPPAPPGKVPNQT